MDYNSIHHHVLLEKYFEQKVHELSFINTEGVQLKLWQDVILRRYKHMFIRS